MKVAIGEAHARDRATEADLILLVEIEAYAAQDGEITRHVLYIGDNRAVWSVVAIAYCRSAVELG